MKIGEAKSILANMGEFPYSHNEQLAAIRRVAQSRCLDSIPKPLLVKSIKFLLLDIELRKESKNEKSC
ncbi:MAG: hypothetical protein IIZ23_07255 [Ruminococcus sp.]|nr:hypothetical protein [Ruminococcus sp.]